MSENSIPTLSREELFVNVPQTNLITISNNKVIFLADTEHQFAMLIPDEMLKDVNGDPTTTIMNVMAVYLAESIDRIEDLEDEIRELKRWS